MIYLERPSKLNDQFESARFAVPKLITQTFESNRIDKIVVTQPSDFDNKNTPVTFDRGFILILSSGSNQPAMELLILTGERKGELVQGEKEVWKEQARTLYFQLLFIFISSSLLNTKSLVQIIALPTLTHQARGYHISPTRSTPATKNPPPSSWHESTDLSVIFLIHC